MIKIIHIVNFILDKPIYNEDSPTNSHVNLKQLISLVDKTTAQLPLLTKKSIYDGQNLVENLSFDSYEELLATAIINHVRNFFGN